MNGATMVRAASFVASLGLLFLAVVAGGCSANAASDVLCVPNSRVRCICSVKERGTKLCAEDGKSFGECEECTPDDTSSFGVTSPGASAACGNSKIDTGEGCDQGEEGGDVCSADCIPSGDPPAANGCPGMPVHVWDQSMEVFGRTTTYRNANRSTAYGGSASPDRIYALTAHKSGKLTAAVTRASFDHTLYVRTTCNGAESVGSDKNADKTGESVTFDVKSGSTYYLVVDGGNDGDGQAKAGTFSITFQIL